MKSFILISLFYDCIGVCVFVVVLLYSVVLGANTRNDTQRGTRKENCFFLYRSKEFVFIVQKKKKLKNENIANIQLFIVFEFSLSPMVFVSYHSQNVLSDTQIEWTLSCPSVALIEIHKRCG